MSNKEKIGLLILSLFFWDSVTSANAQSLNMSNYTPNIIEGYNTGYLEQHPVLRYSNRDISKIEQVVIHHFAAVGQNAKIVARYHVWNTDKGKSEWPGTGYHVIIENDGTIVLCFPLTKITYGIKNENTKSINIALAGHFDNEQVRQEQLKALYYVLALLKQDVPQVLKIIGHRDGTYTSKSCPGENMYKYLKTMPIPKGYYKGGKLAA